MTKRILITDFISLIRDSHPLMVDIYMKGSCLNFFCILHSRWPEAAAWSNIDHVVTKIGDRYYDIRGDVTQEVKRDGRYVTYCTGYSKRKVRKKFLSCYFDYYKLPE